MDFDTDALKRIDAHGEQLMDEARGKQAKRNGANDDAELDDYERAKRALFRKAWADDAMFDSPSPATVAAIEQRYQEASATIDAAVEAIRVQVQTQINSKE